MIVEQITGGWCISALIEGYLVTRRYFGYSKQEAVSLFNEEKLVTLSQ